MSKVLKIAGVSVLALGLVLGLTIPALASPAQVRPWADDSQGKVVKGKVLSVGDQEFVIQSGEQELTISVDEDTKYYRMSMLGRIMALVQHRLQFRLQNQEELQAQAGDGGGSGLQNWVRERASARNQARLQNQISQTENAEDTSQPGSLWLRCLHALGGGAEFGDIAVGDTVAVWLAPQESGYLAERVVIVKPTDYASVSGTIEGFSSEPKTITIAPDVGGSITLNYNESTEFILKGTIGVEAGQSARVIYDSDNMLAKTVVVYSTGS